MSLAPIFGSEYEVCANSCFGFGQGFGVLRDEFDGDLKQPMQTADLEWNKIYLVLCLDVAENVEIIDTDESKTRNGHDINL
mmetsp:Transcript_27026/g.39541  ORF Transcript_27026/g.39541 Transcript_27026/m.39541 type:complete len:81 (+) Transcript_27026:1606-1848(+)